MLKVLLTITAVIAALGSALILALGVKAYTPAIVDERGEPRPDSIAVLEAVELGGMRQWITIRGHNRHAPVVLWLHGGPGGPQMPFAHRYNRELEEHVVLVQWDQRGAGKSNPRDFDTATMQVAQYLQDALELVVYLRTRLDAEQIVLLGHSWGSQLGLLLAQQHPQYFSTYIGVSQVVHHEQATQLASDWLSGVIDNESDRRALQAIEIPARRHADYRALNSLVSHYGGSFDLPFLSLARVALGASEYTAPDYWRLYQGMARGGGPMHQDGIMAGYDMARDVPALAVPAYFLMGERDYNTPLALVREYQRVLQAPYSEVVVFGHSAHLPFMAEPEKFTEELVRIILGSHSGRWESVRE